MIFNRILVIKLKHIGDVLLTTPVFTALKEAWPRSRVSAVVRQGTEAMLTDNPSIDELLIVNSKSRHWREPLRFARGLRQRRFDLVLELSGGNRGAIYTWLSGAERRVGFDHPRRSWWQRRYAFNLLLPRPPVRWHTVEQHLAAVQALGWQPGDTGLKFYWNGAIEYRVRELLEKHHLEDRGFALVHPGARWLFKSWTASGYAAVIEVLERDYQLPVVLTAAPEDRELDLVADIVRQASVPIINLAGRLSLKELGALIAQARLFLGVDSAPMHLAAAVGTPTVALFGPSGDFNWRPWGEGHVVIKKGWDCQPCGQDGCQGTKISRCLTELTPAEVLGGVAQILGP
ncbi:MAG: putative lipopolysaccharide heptosyltransferase III [Desulfobacca sp. 4484_104]|nr:MAG: putative lipopolysaccharide heptosyltransferase III [Desulfobacca sp. 4484_104]RLA87707.1 MAG: putative lipopolysaccharide heptosyltransferase III [Deltaproteobacteria bacterium]